MITFKDQGSVEIQHRIRCVWSPTRVYKQIISAQTQITPFRIGDHSIDDVTVLERGATTKRTRKTDQHHAKKNASFYHPDKEKLQKKES